MNYLSLWIGNLGVVPLFSLAFFLFLPLALSLFFLILFVFKVFEPIFITFVKLLNLKHYFLTFLIYIVKIFLISTSFDAGHTMELTKASNEIFISKGEQKEVSIQNLKSFSIGNKSVISSKYLKRSRKLLIKGKSIGFSDIVIWANNTPRKLNIYVISKKEQLKGLKLAASLKKLNLSVKPIDKYLMVEGQVSNEKEYILFHKLRQNPIIIDQVTYTKTLKRKILEKIYLKLNNKVDSIQCHFKESNPYCNFDETSNFKSLKKSLSELYGVQFESSSKFKSNSNYHVQIEIIKAEIHNNSNIFLGTQKLEGIFANYENSNSSFYNNNKVFIQEKDLNAKLIAKPEIIMNLEKQALIELGQETPFVTTNNNSTQTNWKFSGLRIKLKIIPKEGALAIDLDSELTAPQGTSVSGKRIKQQLIISPHKKKRAFHIKLSQTNKHIESLPIINKIPILKEIFSNNEKRNSQISILGFITVNEDIYGKVN